MHYCALFLLLFIGVSTKVPAQDTTSIYAKALFFPDKLFGAINKKAQQAENKLNIQSNKYLYRLAKQEKRLKRKLLRRSPQLAGSIFGNIDSLYNAFKTPLVTNNRFSKVYSGHLDSLTTAIHLLQSNSIYKLTSNPDADKALEGYKSLQEKFNQTDQIRKRLDQRQLVLKEQLQALGFMKQYRRFQKQVYYYKAQVLEYKAAFEDPTKLEKKVLELAMKVPRFKEFFARHSELGQLFALPGGQNPTEASVTGLQTRESMQQLLQNRFGSGSGVTQTLQQNVQNAQGQLNALKDKVSSLSNGDHGNGNAEMPDFKPNNQKTKSILKRIEFGSNLQTVKGTRFFPVTSDVGLSVGYKLNDKSAVGLGIAYKIGCGNGWNHMRITHQGIGLRSYLDYKLKGALYMSGGYEQNYRSAFRNIEQLKNYNAWQTSGLIGLSKKYKISNKFKGNMQLLWDFLSYQQIPQTQPFLFRVGYSLK